MIVYTFCSSRYVVHLSDHPVHRAVGDDDNPGRVGGHSEVGQKFADKFDLVKKVFGSDASTRIHQKNLNGKSDNQTLALSPVY